MAGCDGDRFVGRDRGQQIEPGCGRALIGRQRQAGGMRKLHDLDVDR